MRDRIVTGIAAAVAALALSGCGEAAPPEERLAAAREATTADTARLALELATEMGGEGSRMDLTIVGDGEADFAAEQAALELEVPGMGERMRTVVDGDVLYSHTVVAGSGSGGSELRWRRHERSSPGGAEMLFGASMAGGSPDPTVLLAALGAVEGSIEPVGADTIRDTAVDGFAFTAPAAALAGGADVPAELADLDMAMEAWLDADNRVRRLTATLELADLLRAENPDAVFGARDGTFTITLELFGFGADVAIDVPDDDDIVGPADAFGAEQAPAVPPDGVEEGAQSDAMEIEVEAEAESGAVRSVEPEAERAEPAEPAEPAGG